MLCLAQGVAEPCQLRLAQKALTPSLAILFDMPARIGAVGPQAVLLSPSEKLREQRQRPIGLVRRARQLVMQLGNVLAGIVRANSFTLPKRQNPISWSLIFLHFSGSI